MKVTVVGCSGSYPGPASAASCYLVEAPYDGRVFRVLLDLGNGALGALQQHTDIYAVDAVLVSHAHADHCIDLCSYYVARKYHPAGASPPLPVYGPRGIADRIARGYDMDPEPGMRDTFAFREMTPGRFPLGPFEVAVDRVNHPVETFGVRLEHAGHAVAYSGDTGPSAALAGLARGADLLLCEASFVEGAANPPDLHLTGREAADVAAQAAARRLVLTHLVPWNDPQQVLADAAASSYDGPVQLARAGATYLV